MSREEMNINAFAIGEKVVCVNDNWVGNDTMLWNNPILHEVYTIELVMHDGAVSLKEVDNSHVDRELHKRGINLLAAFWPWHFSKLKTFQEEESMAFEEHLKEVLV